MSRLIPPLKCKNCQHNWRVGIYETINGNSVVYTIEDYCASCTQSSEVARSLKVCDFCKRSLKFQNFEQNRSFCHKCSDRFDYFGERICETCEARFIQVDFKTASIVERCCPSCEKKQKTRIKIWMIFLVPFILYGCWSHLTEPNSSGLPDPTLDVIQVRP